MQIDVWKRKTQNKCHGWWLIVLNTNYVTFIFILKKKKYWVLLTWFTDVDMYGVYFYRKVTYWHFRTNSFMAYRQSWLTKSKDNFVITWFSLLFLFFLFNKLIFFPYGGDLCLLAYHVFIATKQNPKRQNVMKWGWWNAEEDEMMHVLPYK